MPLDDTATKLSEDLDAAMDSLGVESEEATEASAPESVEAAESAPAETEAKETTEEKPATEGRDPKGRFAPKLTGPVKPTPRAGLATAPAAAPVPGAPAEPTLEPVKPVEAMKPPQSWKASAREEWAKLPRVAQEEVLRRERETAVALNESTEARKQWGEFSKVVAPYEGMIRAEGGTIASAAASLFQTAAALRTAPPQHKAGIVAGLIKNFGIDVNMLADALDGQPSAPGQTQPQQQGAYRDPRVDQLFQSLQQSAQAREQQMHQAEAQAASDFASSHEFYDDVREEMADLIEVYARRGIALDYSEAYNRAVQGHPEISAVLKQREEAKLASTGNPATQRARAASSSVRSRPATGAPAPVGNSLESALEASIAALQGR